MSVTVPIGDDGKIHIPAALRQQINAKAGDLVTIRVESPGVLGIRSQKLSPAVADELFGELFKKEGP